MFQSLIGIKWNFNFSCKAQLSSVALFQSLIGIKWNFNTATFAVLMKTIDVSIPNRD